jgi:hypothetical protein
VPSVNTNVSVQTVTNTKKSQTAKKKKGDKKKLWHAPSINSLDVTYKKNLENRTLVGGDPGKNKPIQFVDQQGKALSYDSITRRKDM